eukprot:Colp12_sorted_trinity150504_noHs@20050
MVMLVQSAFRKAMKVAARQSIGFSHVVRHFGKSSLLCKEKTFGLMFDIDGVIIRGERVLPQAKEAFKLLVNGDKLPRVPYLFLTNGGGVLEELKAKQLAKWLDVEVAPSQVVLSHSPFQHYNHLFDRHVLVIGQGDLVEIATAYGFKRECIHTIDEVTTAYPLLDVVCHSKRKLTVSEHQPDFPKIEAILCFSDPVAWETHLQVLTDLLVSDGTPGVLAEKQQVQMIFSNPDMLWAAQFSQPRFGQGAFRACLETLYKEVTGRQLLVTQLGKPEGITYDYATKLLENQSLCLNTGLGTVYAVGDNPKADIRGANRQPHMKSILVRTGVFQGEHNDHEDPADFVVDDVHEAVRLVFQLENYKD